MIISHIYMLCKVCSCNPVCGIHSAVGTSGGPFRQPGRSGGPEPGYAWSTDHLGCCIARPPGNGHQHIIDFTSGWSVSAFFLRQMIDSISLVAYNSHTLTSRGGKVHESKSQLACLQNAG